MFRNNLNSVLDTLISKGYNINSVFDIGANKGRWTAAFQPKMQDAQFFLFEANPKHQRPRGLAPKNKWFNVVLSNPKITEVEFYSTGGTGDSYYKEQTRHYNRCKPTKMSTTSLDELVKTHSLPLPQLIKLDTQGSELDILSGAKTIINHVDVIVTEMPILPYNHGAPTFDEYMNFLIDLGFIPIGMEGTHFGNNMLVQVDIVFLRKHIKLKYYGNDKLFSKEFRIQ